jgi:branched-chain amino acid transport system permease protein
MDTQIALFLAQDGLITGSIYALLAVAIVLVFTITRVIFVPQGEFVALGALTMASLQTGKAPGTIWLLRERNVRRVGLGLVLYGVLPCLLALGVGWLASRQMPLLVQAFTTLALVVPLGPILYRIAYQPVAEASVLVLLIISVAVHLALTSLGLILFGAEGSRTPPFSEARWQFGGMQVTGQSLVVLAASLLAIGALFWFFNRTFSGKALKATAVNRTGAQLMGISATGAGALAFTLAAAIGALSGLMIGPITTVFYDTGFLIGLKGFVAAIIGGLVSYPLAAAGAILLGMLESYSSFWASAFKEVIVFTLILPVLLWRSLKFHHVEEDDE